MITFPETTFQKFGQFISENIKTEKDIEKDLALRNCRPLTIMGNRDDLSSIITVEYNGGRTFTRMGKEYHSGELLGIKIMNQYIREMKENADEKHIRDNFEILYELNGSFSLI